MMRGFRRHAAAAEQGQRDDETMRAFDSITLTGIARDVLYALRTIRRMPGFALAVVLTLGLGIAGTTIIVSAVNAVFLRHLPVRAPDQLYVVEEHWSNGSSSTWMGLPTYPYDLYLRYRAAHPATFVDMAAFRIDAVSVRTTPTDDAVIRGSTIASSNYFRLLGVQPAIGRFFSDVADGAEPVEPEVVISYERWQHDYVGSPSALGRQLIIDSRSYTIIGVTPPTFLGTMNGLVSQLWIPAGVYRLPNGATDSAERNFDVTLFGRLRPATTAARAQSELAAVALNLPRANSGAKLLALRLEPLDGVPAMGRMLVVAFIAMLSLTAALVMGIAATNVAAMLLTRAAHRRREIAIRLALGAGRARVVTQLLAETLLLSMVGAATGVGLARLAIGLLPTIQAPVAVDVRLDLALDLRVLAIVIFVGCAAGLAAGAAPALNAVRDDIVVGLRIGGTAEPLRRRHLRRNFVIAQVAISLVLLFAAGLFVRALHRALETDPGFDTANIVVGSINTAPHGYDRVGAQALYTRIVERLRARPEILAATYGYHLPLSGSYMGIGIPHGDARRRILINYGSAEPGYFKAMRVPIIQGRGFSDVDAADAPAVMIVNETLARTFWPNEPALGKSLLIRGQNRTVVGVSRDGKIQTLNETSRSFAYLPAAQLSELAIVFYAKARVDPTSALMALRSEIRAQDPNLALEQPSTLDAQLDVFRLPQRVAAWLIGAFGVVGLIVASIGLFGVLAFDVTQRTQEFGVRLALGATPRSLVLDVMGKALRIVGYGAGIGLVASLAVGRAAESMLFGVSATDPTVLVVVPALLALAGLVASALPAIRAARVDPVVSLRAE